jgi:pyruvate/2-oxoglutarate/acetoin dehydrogenase E1 component
MAKISFSKAVRQALEGEMLRDESIFVAGEDVTWGGTMKLYYGLADKFPDRILDTPISETSIAGLGLGAAIMGMHPLIDFNIMDFTLCAFDEIANGIAKYRFMTDGKLSVPLVIHVASGAIPGAGPQHAQSLEALYAHIPGLKVVFPSNPADGAGLMRTVLRDPDPVVFIDSMQLVGVKGDVPEGDYVVPLGSARLCRQGDDVTVITYGSTVPVAESAAERLMEEGAKDVALSSIQMKKGRPATLMTVMCADDEDEKKRVVGLIFKYTTTIGIRELISERYVLDRVEKTYDTPYGAVRVKEVSGYGISRSKIEYENLARIAREQGVSIAEARRLVEASISE